MARASQASRDTIADSNRRLPAGVTLITLLRPSVGSAAERTSPARLSAASVLRDGLVGDVLGGGERGGGAGPLVAQPLEHGYLRDRQLDFARPGRLAQPPV